jgi:hypothetical protein
MLDWTWSDSRTAWLASSPAEDASLVVAGSRECPDARLCSVALSLIENAPKLKETIAEYLIGTPIEISRSGHQACVVHPERPTVTIVQIELRDTQQPDLAHVLVVTEYPDPYYLYEVRFVRMSIVNITGRFW